MNQWVKLLLEIKHQAWNLKECHKLVDLQNRPSTYFRRAIAWVNWKVWSIKSNWKVILDLRLLINKKMIMKKKMITNSMHWDLGLILITQAINLKEVTQLTENLNEWNHPRVYWTCWCRKIKFLLINIDQEVIRLEDLQQRNTKKIQRVTWIPYHWWEDSNIYQKTSLQLKY